MGILEVGDLVPGWELGCWFSATDLWNGCCLSVSGEEAIGRLLKLPCSLLAALRPGPRMLCIKKGFPICGANDDKCEPSRPSAKGRVCLPGCPGR